MAKRLIVWVAGWVARVAESQRKVCTKVYWMRKYLLRCASTRKCAIMGVKFQCPNGHHLHVKAFLAGKRGRCPQCGASVVIPLPSEPPAAARTVAGAPPRSGGANNSGEEQAEDSTDTIIMDEAEQTAADAAMSGKSAVSAREGRGAPIRASEELGFAPEAEPAKLPAKKVSQTPPPLLLQVRPRGPVDDPLREAIAANRVATETTVLRNQLRSPGNGDDDKYYIASASNHSCHRAAGNFCGATGAASDWERFAR